MTFDEAAATITRAFSPEQLFPELEKAKAVFRALATVVHPDKANDPRADRVFAKLNDYYTRRTGAVGTEIRVGDWTVHGGLARGGVCDVHRVTGRDLEGALKVTRQEKDNLLLSNEAATLKSLHKKLDDNWLRYLPRLLDSFLIQGKRANVVSRDPETVTLEQIRRSNPNGIMFEHVVWMGNRLFEILGAVHRHDILHGSILPHHLMYRPSDHGLVVIDWTASAQNTGYVPLIHKRWIGHYPPEVLAKSRISQGTDLYMAGKALQFAAAPASIPRRFRWLLESLCAESTRSRPDDAWIIQDRWRDAAESTYGKPKFVELGKPN